MSREVNSWGSGTPVVLVHGSLATGADEWQAQRSLADEGFRLYDLAERIGASRAVVAGAGHEVQFTGPPLNTLLLALWRRAARLALSFALIASVVLSACSRTPHATAPVAPANDAATGLPTRVVHEASGITLVLIPAGTFRMGLGKAAHRRVIRNPFYLGETEVTNAQFRRFVDATEYRTDAERGVELDGHGKGSFATSPPGSTTGPREWSEAASWRTPFPGLGNPAPVDEHPVVHVSWNDTIAFAAHFRMRLPSEAEWEYAAWAGAETGYPWGDDPAAGAGYANLADLSYKKLFPRANDVFPFDDGAATLSPVGTYKPNAWGLKDMIGNLEEWAQDTYAEYPADGADESPVVGEGVKVIRGRNWLDGPGMNRAALQSAARRDFVGFRVAVSVSP